MNRADTMQHRKPRETDTPSSQPSGRAFRVSLVVFCSSVLSQWQILLPYYSVTADTETLSLSLSHTHAHTHTASHLFLFCLPPRLQELASVCHRRWETKKRGTKKKSKRMLGVSKNSENRGGEKKKTSVC